MEFPSTRGASMGGTQTCHIKNNTPSGNTFTTGNNFKPTGAICKIASCTPYTNTKYSMKKTKLKYIRRHGRVKNKNRTWDNTHNTWAVPIKTAVVIVIFTVCFVAIAAIKNDCDRIHSKIADQEKKQYELNNEYVREQNKWDLMRTPKNLELRLLRHGIAMTTPKSGQRIAMYNYERRNTERLTTYAQSR